MEKKAETSVREHCANYNYGYICSGVMIGKHLEQWIDSDYAHKPCKIKEGEECEYYTRIVEPSL